jgi:uncharacterized membrane protein (DUF2068 family)
MLSSLPMTAPQQKPPLGLRAIALVEAVKGLLVVAAACGLLSLRHTDVHAVVDAFLLRHGIDPEVHYRRLFIESVASATHHHLGQIVGLACAYAAVRFVESYGLWRAKHWAEWFAVLSGGLYLPFEITHLLRRPTWLSAAVILANVVLVVYLARLLRRDRVAAHSAMPG